MLYYTYYLIYKNISDTGQLNSAPSCITMPMNLSSINALTASELGVMMFNALINKVYLVEQHNEYYQLTDTGKQWYEKSDININKLDIRPEVLPMHIKWTVRQNYLAGPLSLAIIKQFIQRGWLKLGDF